MLAEKNKSPEKWAVRIAKECQANLDGIILIVTEEQRIKNAQATLEKCAK